MEARIWRYAKALGKSLSQVAPEDFRMNWTSVTSGSSFNVSCTIATQQEAEAICEIINQLSRSLSRHREAVRGDIFLPEPKPSFREELQRMFGPSITFEEPTRARHAMAEKEGEDVAAN